MTQTKNAELRAATAPFESPSLWLGLYQIATSIGLYLVTLAAMYWPRDISYGLPLLLAIPASLLLYRVPFDTPQDWTRERRSVWTTNLAVLVSWTTLAAFFGIRAVVSVQLPVVILSTVIGVWLFSVQHRFEGARWSRRGEWSYADAALNGSSHLHLPKILHWATGNIGFHHIHHLSPRVPNYHLAACHHSCTLLQPEHPLSVASAFRAASLTLWDETQSKLVRFRDAV